MSAHLYSEKELSDEIIIVAIDDESFKSPEEGGLDRFNTWNRSYYTEVLKQVESAQPSAVFFDVLFASASDTDTDQAMAAVLSDYSNIYFLKSIGAQLGYDAASQAILYANAVNPLPVFDALVHSGFTRTNATEESNNSSMIFGVSRYYRAVGQSDLEEQIDFQLAEAHLGHSVEAPLINGEMLINYFQKSNGFPRVSFADVVNGKVDPSVFSGKIVLVGATAPILQDRHYTPIDSTEPMPGIEIHANVLQTLLDGAFLQNQSGVDFVLTLGVLLLVSIFIFSFKPVVYGGALLVLELSAFPFYAQWRFNHGTIVDLIWPVVALLASYLAVLAYRNFTEFAEKRKLKAAFSHYVAPEVVHQISEHPELLTLGGERRKITAFFLDIENFTHLSEGLQPQEVVKVINTYFDALSKEIMALGGTVDKFEGDAIMALFGAPVPSEDHAVKACLAALAIRAKMAELNAVSGLHLNVRIGLATGEAIVGNMGSEDRFDYTAMGDTVNTASRLEGANKFYKTRILVTEATALAAGSAIFFREVDSVCLKGKDQVLHVYEVMGTLEGATEAGKTVMKQWQEALAAYRAGQWDNAERGMKAVMAALPDDGPASTLLTRIAVLKMQTPKSWDGVWRYEEK